MNKDDINERLRQLDVEDFVWLVYIGIIIVSFYSNVLERRYFKYNDLESKDRYRKITIGIFAVLLIIYLYFVKDAVDAVKNLKPYDSLKKKNLTYLSLFGAILIAISGFIFFYISLSDEDVEVEIAFT